MPTYWDAFLEDYPKARNVSVPVALEAFWYYLNCKNVPNETVKVKIEGILSTSLIAEIKKAHFLVRIDSSLPEREIRVEVNGREVGKIEGIG